MASKKGPRYLLTLARSAVNARTTAGWVLVVWALFAGMFAVLCMLMLLALRHLLLDEVAADELAADAVEHTVNITAAARSAVCLASSTYSLIVTVAGMPGKFITSAMAICMIITSI